MSDKTKSRWLWWSGEKRHSSSASPTNPSSPESVEFALRRLTQKLAKNNTLESRLATVPQLVEFLRSTRIDDPRLLHHCWESVHDLLTSTTGKQDAQRAVQSVMCTLLETHFDQLETLRHEFFHIVQSTDIPWKYEALVLITQAGRKIDPFESELIPLLLKWLVDEKLQISALTFVERMIKFNFSSLDELSKRSLIRQVCEISNSATQAKVIESCLNIFDVIVTYGTVPSACLTMLISSLCRTVNIESYYKTSWQIMQNLLQGQCCGYQGVRSLCSILDDTTSRSPASLLRGAVFFLSMALWGSQKIASLQVSPSVVLPSFLTALSTGQSVVAYEVVLAINRLVRKYGSKLRLEWATISNILLHSRAYLSTDVDESLANVLRQVMKAIEDLYNNNGYQGEEDVLFYLLERFTDFISDEMLATVIERKSQAVTPINENWIEALSNLASMFIARSQQLSVRQKALQVLRTAFDTYHHYYGEAMLSNTLPILLQVAASDTRLEFRLQILDFLLYLMKFAGQTHFNTILEVIYGYIITTDSPQELRRTSTTGLIDLFYFLFPQKNFSLTLTVFGKLLQLLEHSDLEVRQQVVLCLTKLSANHRYYVRIGDVTTLYLKLYTSKRAYIGCFPFITLWNALTQRLRQEANFDLILLIANGLMNFIRNRWIMLNVDVKEFTTSLCRLLETRTFGKNITSLPVSDEQRLELIILGYELLALLIPNIAELGNLEVSTAVVSAFYSGIAGKWSCSEQLKSRIYQSCLSGLTQCYCELRDASLLSLNKILSSLVQLLRISSEAENMIQILEHFHAVARIPGLIAHAISDSGLTLQIFNSILSFTDPSKFSPVYICFAYQVLAVWFLACDLEKRSHYYKLLRPQIMENIQKKSLAAEANLDLLSRFAFTDCEPIAGSLESEFSFLFKNSSSQHWTQGNSLISIRTSQLGWAMISVRRATGTVVWVMQLQNKVKKLRKSQSQDREALEVPEEYLDQLRALLQSLPANDSPQMEWKLKKLPAPSPASAASAPSADECSPRDVGSHQSPSTVGVTDEDSNSGNQLLGTLFLSPQESSSPLDDVGLTAISRESDANYFPFGPLDHGEPSPPSLIFLQLQQIPFFTTAPILLKSSEALDRAISVLDKALCYETHKIGVIFVGEGQIQVDQVMRNSWGSPRYTQFLRSLGEIVTLRDTTLYTAGLDKENDLDGKFSIMFKDDVMQVMFHVATMMPTNETNLSYTNKLRHIGNDYVIICWCENETPFDTTQIPSQFNSVAIIITPLDPGYYRVQAKYRIKLPHGSGGPITQTPKVVSQDALPHLVRLTALHANVGCRQYMLTTKQIDFVSNIEERLRQIRQISERFAEEPYAGVEGTIHEQSNPTPSQLERRPLRAFTRTL